MALDKPRLQQAIAAAFESAKDDAWSTGQVAAALANAVHDYVRGAAVAGVQTHVEVHGGGGVSLTGTGSQTGKGRLE